MDQIADVEPAEQRQLSAAQVEAFHHDEFVQDQVTHFEEMFAEFGEGAIIDVGGGCGFFLEALGQNRAWVTRLMDSDPASIKEARRRGVVADLGDALAPQVRGDERIVCFNLILHHLIGRNEKATRRLQVAALAAWAKQVEGVFVHEYIYESWIPRFSGRLIFEITARPLLSSLARQVARVAPAFRANTFGVGVRFRSHAEWIELFAEAGYRTADVRVGAPERVSSPLRLLLIRTIRRDSYKLVPLRDER